jgi:hypothetical protein
MPGRNDTAEFKLIKGQWTSESGGDVELGGLFCEDSADVQRVLANARPRALSAGLT